MPDVEWLELPHARLEYLRIPARSAGQPTLLLLHEALGGVAHWKDFPSRLAEFSGCEVLVYSRQGHGRSSAAPQPRPLDYLSAGCPDELGALLEALDLHDVLLVGHSDGASVALAYAARNDPRVRGVVAMAPHVIVEAETLAGIRAADSQFRNSDLLERLRAYHGSNLEGVFCGWVDTWLHPEFAAWNLHPELAQIRVPVLAFQGAGDQYATAEQLALIECGVAGPCRTALLDDCRHVPHREAGEQTLQLIGEFIAEQGRAVS